MLETPVALFVFRRPELTRRVIDAVSAVRPRQLLVICDGPRRNRPEDVALVAQTRAIIERVNWPCEVRTHYADQNLGCGRCVSEGLNWVFDTVEEAIILEDDCVPHPSFFRYCSTLLTKYPFHSNVSAICGTNYFPRQRFSADSYFFSKYFFCWGWASWRRAWKQYDYHMVDYPVFRRTMLRSLCDSDAEFNFHRRRFDDAYHRRTDTWDYQCVYSFWKQQGICIHPDVNLISNIGTGSGGTHTADHGAGNSAGHEDWNAALPVADIGELRHPAVVARNRAAEQYVTQHAILGPPKPARNWQQRWTHRAAKLRRSIVKRTQLVFPKASGSRGSCPRS